MLTIKELEEKLRKLYNDFGDPKLVDLNERDFMEIFIYEGNLKPLKGSDFEFIEVSNAGDGNDAWCVLKHLPTSQLFGWVGYYSSWDSDDWTTEMVMMKPVTVIQYAQEY